MIHFVDRDNRHLYEAQLDEMFRLRHQIYVDSRGWKDLKKPDGREIDQFDNDDAIYLLRLDADKRVYGALRLIQSTKPHLMSEVFPHIVTNGPIPRDPNVYEMTRVFALDHPEEGNSKHFIIGEIFLAMTQWCLANDITHISVVSDTFYVPILVETKFDAKMLSLPTKYPEGECIALQLGVSRETLDAIGVHQGIDPDTTYWQYVADPAARSVA